jgi:FkbM family methyltransferase
MRLSDERRRSLQRRIAGWHGRPLVDALARGARLFVSGYENLDWDQATNGEQRVIDLVLGGQRSPVVLDVGANIGDWTAAVLTSCPTATVHAFELVPSIADRLQARFETDGRVVVNPIGLSDSEREVTVDHDPRRPTLSGVATTAVADTAVERLVLPVSTGDSYVARQSLGHIDLMKVDAEGHDFAVLSGFAKTIDAGAVGAIQFEYNFTARAARTNLGDFYDLLVPAGYVIGKVYPRCVVFRDYEPTRDEYFPGLNYLAVHADAEPLVGRLSTWR